MREVWMQRSRRFLAMVAIVAPLCWASIALAMPDPPQPPLQKGAVLRSAAGFAVLGELAVTSSGATRVTGNLGVSPGSAISGFPPGTVRIGAIYRDDAIARQAQRDLAAAYDEVSRRTCTASLTGSHLAPGVYCAAAAFVLHGTLILDAGGDPEAVWILRVTTSLLADPESKVLVTGGGSEGNVYWQMGTTATIGDQATFAGTILAHGAIAVGSGATITGRALTRSGGVTLVSSSVNACCKPLTVSPATLPGGMECAEYNATLTAGGGMAPYTFALTSGELPDGLTLSPAGVISGNPTAGGSSTFTVTATDANGCPGTAEYTIEIVPCGSTVIVISPTTLDSGTVSVDYLATLTASGGTAPYAFSVTCSTLPPGITLTATGVLSGVPTMAGIFTFTVTATDATGTKGCRTYKLRICPVITIEPAVLPDGEVGTLYCDVILTANGVPPHTFSVPQDKLPPGILPSLCGTPTASGDFTFPITVTDANGCTAVTWRTIHIKEKKPDPPCIITLEPAELPGGIVGTEYKQTIKATGCEPHKFALTAGTLPPGIPGPSVVDGKLSGIPTKAGTYVFTITVTGTQDSFALRVYTIVIVCPTIILTPATLPSGKVGTIYNRTITASGGTAPYTFVIDGDLPNGITHTLPDTDTTVTISGSPTTAGTFPFTITATDSYCCKVTQPYTITIRPAAVGTLAIPTLSPWLLSLFSLLLAAAGIACIRKWGG